MKVELRIGWRKPDKTGMSSLGVSVRENYGTDATKEVRVRTEATSRIIAGHVRDGLGDKLCEDSDLVYVGYKITWRTKTVQKGGSGLAEVDFQEKKSCPPEILAYGRKLVEMLRNNE